MCWNSGLTYSDGTSVGSGHEIVRSEIKNTGTFGEFPLPKPLHNGKHGGVDEAQRGSRLVIDVN